MKFGGHVTAGAISPAEVVAGVVRPGRPDHQHVTCGRDVTITSDRHRRRAGTSGRHAEPAAGRENGRGKYLRVQKHRTVVQWFIDLGWGQQFQLSQ